MSFSCPHFRPDDEHCLWLKTDCVLGGKTVFAMPVAERIREREEEKRRRARDDFTKRTGRR